MNDVQKPWQNAEDFNEEKAWNLIQNLRGEISQLKATRDQLTQERDTALGDLQKAISERDEKAAEVEAKATAEAQALAKLAGFENLRTKENLLLDAGLPRDLAGNITGEDVEEWKTSVERFVALRGTGVQERRPDPAQAAADYNGDLDERVEMAKQIFGG